MLVMATDQTAPAHLELVREFVNTLDVEDDIDTLATPAEALAWLQAHGLEYGERSLDEQDRERLVAVREALRGLLLANNAGDSPPAEALELLNEQSAEAAVILHFDGDGADLVDPLRRGRLGDRPAALDRPRLDERPHLGAAQGVSAPRTASGRSTTTRATARAPGARSASAATGPRPAAFASATGPPSASLVCEPRRDCGGTFD